MILEGLHEKDIFMENHPFRLETSSSEGFYYPLHWHNAIELVFIQSGKCKLTVNGLEYFLEEKEILLLPSGEIHDIQALGYGMRYFIQFDISLLDTFSAINNLKPVLMQTMKIAAVGSASLHSTLEKLILEIIEEYEAKHPAYELALNARILDILVLLSRNMVNRSEPENIRNMKKVFGLEKINSSFKYIENNYQNDLTLKDVANAVGFSEFHFSRLFKELTEKNFHSYLNEFRIKKAERLLAGNDMPITQIAHEVGFNSLATFNRIFRKLKGRSPTAFRNG